MIRNRTASRQTRALLNALQRHPAEWRHGYDLAKEAGLSSGTLYPILIRLHERGFLDAEWRAPAVAGRPPRHVYRLSRAGLSYALSLDQACVSPPVGRRGEALA